MEFVGYKITEARDADGKRKVQKKENRILDMLPESKMTFRELADWYLDLDDVKRLVSYERIAIGLNTFNVVHGDKIVIDLKLPVSKLVFYTAETRKTDSFSTIFAGRLKPIWWQPMSTRLTGM